MVPGPMKTCISCKQELPLESFTKMTKAKDGKHPYCRSCNSQKSLAWQKTNPERNRALRAKSALRTRNGLEQDEYQSLLIQQGKGCAICGIRDPGHARRSRRFDVDHCHRTGRIRGLLCQACNMGMGQFGDDPARLRRAAEYLEQE